ncbi:MAG: class I SAM-dependent methyltransferase [Geobacteraceae bacterium]
MQTIDFKRLGLSSGDRLLDLGCGEGRHALSAYLYEDVAAVGVDLSQKDILTARGKSRPFLATDNLLKSLDLQVADALNLPFPAASFDKVICSEVLEHIPDFIAVLLEINRVLKPSGVLSVSVPRFGPEWVCWALSDEYHANEGGHLRIFKAKELRRAIEQIGMTYFDRHWAHALHAPFWWLQCLFWKSRETSRLVKSYHALLVWDMMKKPRLTRFLDHLLNPLIGKSVVMYFKKGPRI